MPRDYSNLVGRRFGKLVVIPGEAVLVRRNLYGVPCLCDCGTMKHVAPCHLMNGNNKSCGCIATHNGARRSLADRFWEKVNKDGPTLRPDLGPCWVWTGCLDQNGYGRIGSGGDKGRPVLSTRAAFFIQHGRWPNPCALHRCDNPPCVRWEHLYEGSYAENTRDMLDKGRDCHGESRLDRKLSAKDVLAIRSAAGSNQEIANLYGVSRALVRGIRLRHKWRHLP